jgi:hypothetical protein
MIAARPQARQRRRHRATAATLAQPRGRDVGAQTFRSAALSLPAGWFHLERVEFRAHRVR